MSTHWDPPQDVSRRAHRTPDTRGVDLYPPQVATTSLRNLDSSTLYTVQSTFYPESIILEHCLDFFCENGSQQTHTYQEQSLASLCSHSYAPSPAKAPDARSHSQVLLQRQQFQLADAICPGRSPSFWLCVVFSKTSEPKYELLHDLDLFVWHALS